MQTTNQAKHVAPQEGRTLWVAGDMITFKVVGDDTGGAFTLGEDITPPGGGPPPHIHHREDELFCVLEGEYEFLLGERTIHAGAGSIIYGPRNVPHTFKNVGTKSARMLAVVTPAGIEEFFEEVGAETTEGPSPPTVDQEQIQRLLAAASKYGIEILLPSAE